MFASASFDSVVSTMFNLNMGAFSESVNEKTRLVNNCFYKSLYFSSDKSLQILC